MFERTVISAFPTSKSDAKNIELKPNEARPSRPLLVLDMGEASREEGFRLNGCR